MRLIFIKMIAKKRYIVNNRNMMQWIKPTRITLSVFFVLLVGFYVIPFLISFIWAYTSTPKQITEMYHMITSPVIFFFVDPIVSVLWLYILGCIIVLIMNKKNNKKVSRRAV